MKARRPFVISIGIGIGIGIENTIAASSTPTPTPTPIGQRTCKRCPEFSRRAPDLPGIEMQAGHDASRTSTCPVMNATTRGHHDL
jgi:hypothetical protein